MTAEEMKMDPSRLNGSVDLLASAIRTVFSEAMANTATKDDVETLLSVCQESAEGKKATASQLRVDRENTISQFAEVNKSLGILLAQKSGT